MDYKFLIIYFVTCLTLSLGIGYIFPEEVYLNTRGDVVHPAAHGNVAEMALMRSSTYYLNIEGKRMYDIVESTRFNKGNFFVAFALCSGVFLLFLLVQKKKAGNKV